MTDFGEGSISGDDVRGKQFNNLRGLNGWLKHHGDHEIYGIEAMDGGDYAVFFRPPPEDTEEEPPPEFD